MRPYVLRRRHPESIPRNLGRTLAGGEDRAEDYVRAPVKARRPVSGTVYLFSSQTKLPLGVGFIAWSAHFSVDV